MKMERRVEGLVSNSKDLHLLCYLADGEGYNELGDGLRKGEELQSRRGRPEHQVKYHRKELRAAERNLGLSSSIALKLALGSAPGAARRGLPAPREGSAKDVKTWRVLNSR
jgi:hypothetical protein